MKKALFLDRDGIINQLVKDSYGILKSPGNRDSVRLMDGIVQIIRWANNKNIPTIEITNQPDVAKGTLTLEELDSIEEQIHCLLKSEGAHIDYSYRCLHHINADIPMYKKICSCRKPEPGMLLQASKDHSIDLSKSFFLGDNLTDIEAGYTAGCKTILFPYNKHPNDTPERLKKNKAYCSTKIINSLNEVVPFLSSEWSISEKLIAIIVAGGRGERLRPLTESVPKPMVQVGGKPILLHTIELLKSYGVRDFVLALCYLPEVIKEYFGDGSHFGVSIRYTFEDPLHPLGTAGAIVPAKPFIHSTFIVTYADIIREMDILKMIQFHKENKSTATLHAYNNVSSTFKSTLIFNEDKRLLTFTENESKEQRNDRDIWSNGSLYIFEPGIFKYIHNKKKTDFAKDVFQKMLTEGENISIFQTKDQYFIDIGTIDKLEQAEKHHTNYKS